MDPISGHTDNSWGGRAQVPDATVPRLALQSQGGALPGQAVQPGDAAVSGLVVEAGHAPVGQPVVHCTETTGCISVVKNGQQLQDTTTLLK